MPPSQRRSEHLVDPAFQFLLGFFPEFDLDADVLAAMRAERGSWQAVEPADGVEVVEGMVPRDDAPDVLVLVATPCAAAGRAPGERPAVLWIHGGGYVLGSARESSNVISRIAAELDCVVVSVDYRLAPETPHPGPVEDCLATLDWMAAEAQTLGLDPGRIAVVGESAGGGLAAGLALLTRDLGRTPLCFQGLIYPMIDDRAAVAPDPNPYAGEYIWTRVSNAYGWACLLGHEPGLDGVSPYAAAARAEDLSGLPATFIGVGALDLFVDENIAYAQRLLRAGVPTELHVHPGALHGYLQLGEYIPVGKELWTSLMGALRRSFADISVPA